MKDSICVLIHGFAGSTDEIEYLAEYLQNKGLDTCSVYLAGHTGTKKALKETSYLDWINSAKETVSSVEKNYKNIYLLGFSMGGLISTHLTLNYNIKKIVFINTPIYFWNMRIILKDILTGIRHAKFDEISYYFNSVMGVYPKSAIDFLKILSKSKKILPEVSAPALIIQCKDDESAHYKSAYYIKNKIGSKANLRYFNGGCHQVFKNSIELRDIICEEIYKFLNKTD